MHTPQQEGQESIEKEFIRQTPRGRIVGKVVIRTGDKALDEGQVGNGSQKRRVRGSEELAVQQRERYEKRQDMHGIDTGKPRRIQFPDFWPSERAKEPVIVAGRAKA